MISFIKKWVVFFAGIFIMALGVSIILKVAHLGLDPWDVMFYGLTKTVGLTFGVWNQVIAFILVFITAMVYKRLPQWGTLIDVVMYGSLIDLISLLDVVPTTDHSTEWMVFVLGIIFWGFGGGMYMSAKVGVGPIDGFIQMLSEKYNYSFGFIYIIASVITLTIGFFLGGPIGIGTLLLSLTLGYLYQISAGLWQIILQDRILHQQKAS